MCILCSVYGFQDVRLFVHECVAGLSFGVAARGVRHAAVTGDVLTTSKEPPPWVASQGCQLEDLRVF